MRQKPKIWNNFIPRYLCVVPLNNFSDGGPEVKELSERVSVARL